MLLAYRSMGLASLTSGGQCVRHIGAGLVAIPRDPKSPSILKYEPQSQAGQPSMDFFHSLGEKNPGCMMTAVMKIRLKTTCRSRKKR